MLSPSLQPITIGAAGAGAILFAVVRARIGSTAPVRRLLKGDQVELAGASRAAIAAGFRLGHVAAVACTLAGVTIAMFTTRWVRTHE